MSAFALLGLCLLIAVALATLALMTWRILRVRKAETEVLKHLQALDEAVQRLNAATDAVAPRERQFDRSVLQAHVETLAKLRAAFDNQMMLHGDLISMNIKVSRRGRAVVIEQKPIHEAATTRSNTWPVWEAAWLLPQQEDPCIYSSDCLGGDDWNVIPSPFLPILVAEAHSVVAAAFRLCLDRSPPLRTHTPSLGRCKPDRVAKDSERFALVHAWRFIGLSCTLRTATARPAQGRIYWPVSGPRPPDLTSLQMRGSPGYELGEDTKRRRTIRSERGFH